MSEWPFLGGLIALFIALGRFIDKLLGYLGRVIKNLAWVVAFLILLSHILHHIGAPIPDLLPWLPPLGSILGT